MTTSPSEPTSEHDGPVAAPDHHKVIFENDQVRVLETTIRAGDVAPLHTLENTGDDDLVVIGVELKPGTVRTSA